MGKGGRLPSSHQRLQGQRSDELGQHDFRKSRNQLPPEAFALGADQPEHAPRDLVEEETWQEIVGLPDDVSLRTSADHGSELKAMADLWGSLLESLGEIQDPVWNSMLDAADEFQACTFNSLCGYYRVALACLRTAVELNTIGTYIQLAGTPTEKEKWTAGKRIMSFGQACDKLGGYSQVKVLEDHLRRKMKFSIFAQSSGQNAGSWARNLHSMLSEFTHSRRNYSSVAMWEGSNGPIYVPSSFGRVYSLYLDTMALLFAEVKLARPNFRFNSKLKDMFHSNNIRPSKVAVYSYQFLWPQEFAEIKRK